MNISRALLKRLLWSFGRAFVAAFVVGIAGIAAVPDLSAAKALVVAAIVGGLAAGLRAAEHAFFGSPT